MKRLRRAHPEVRGRPLRPMEVLQSTRQERGYFADRTYVPIPPSTKLISKAT